MSDQYLYSWCTEKSYTKASEHNVVYIPIITLSQSSRSTLNGIKINHCSQKLDWT